jgi:hypothetical protein
MHGNVANNKTISAVRFIGWHGNSTFIDANRQTIALKNQNTTSNIVIK